MLKSFLPSWMQDMAGMAVSLKFMDIVNSSLFPLVFVIPLAVIAILLVDRSETATEARNPPAKRPNAFVERRTSEHSLTGGASSGFVSAPSLATPQAQFERPPTQSDLPLAQERLPPLVLIADDSLVVRTKLSRLLTAAGFRVAEVSDGQQAFDALQKGMIPSVLITDLEMPAMDGFELIAAVHGAIETEHVPIVAITANDDLQARVADLSGVFGIFKKPWNDRALLQRIRTLAAVSEARVATR